jgi:hypothetical protein
MELRAFRDAAQLNRRLKTRGCFAERALAVVPKRQQQRRAAGVARMWQATTAVLFWLVAALVVDGIRARR